MKITLLSCIECITTMKIECGHCGDQYEAESAGADGLADLSALEELKKKGWVIASSKYYSAIGPLCGGCAGTGDWVAEEVSDGML